MFKKLAITGVIAIALVGTFAAPAAADDWGQGEGNPSNCSNNINVGPANPVIAYDGRVVGWTQMRWSYSCQANWTKTWTADGQATILHSDIYEYGPPSPTRRAAVAEDYASSHFTLYLTAGTTQQMCGSAKIWDAPTGKWAFSGVHCYS